MKRETILETSLTAEQIRTLLQKATRQKRKKFFSRVPDYEEEEEDPILFKGDIAENNFIIERITKNPVLIHGEIYSQEGKSKVKLTFRHKPGDLVFYFILCLGMVSICFFSLSTNDSSSREAFLIPLIPITFLLGFFFILFLWEKYVSLEKLKKIIKAKEPGELSV